MTKRDEDYLFEELEDIREGFSQIIFMLKQNSMMLKQIIQVINVYLANHNQENEDDFARNVLANLISSGLDISRFMKR